MNLNRRVPNGLPGGVRGRKFYYFLLLDYPYLSMKEKIKQLINRYWRNLFGSLTLAHSQNSQMSFMGALK